MNDPESWIATIYPFHVFLLNLLLWTPAGVVLGRILWILERLYADSRAAKAHDCSRETR